MSINQSYRRMSQSEAQEILHGVPATFARWFGPHFDDFVGEGFDNYLAWHRELEARESYLDINNRPLA